MLLISSGTLDCSWLAVQCTKWDAKVLPNSRWVSACADAWGLRSHHFQSADININVLCNTVFCGIKFHWLFTNVKSFSFESFNFSCPCLLLSEKRLCVDFGWPHLINSCHPQPQMVLPACLALCPPKTISDLSSLTYKHKSFPSYHYSPIPSFLKRLSVASVLNSSLTWSPPPGLQESRPH